MNPRRAKLAIASVICSAPVVAVASLAFGIYWFAAENRKHGEDVLELSIISLWMLPLFLAGLGLGLFARGFRLACVGLGLLPVLMWGSITLTEGGL